MDNDNITTVIINGVDISPYIEYAGLNFQVNDIESPNAGRNMLGNMNRDRVNTKIRIDVTIRRGLSTEELSSILALIRPATFTVSYEDALLGKRDMVEMYSNNYSYRLLSVKGSNKIWDKFTFPLIEV